MADALDKLTCSIVPVLDRMFVGLRLIAEPQHMLILLTDPNLAMCRALPLPVYLMSSYNQYQAHETDVLNV